MAVPIVPPQTLALRRLWSIDFALPHTLYPIRRLGRHEAFRLGILNALECKNTTILIALNGAIDCLHTGVLTCRDRLCLHVRYCQQRGE